MVPPPASLVSARLCRTAALTAVSLTRTVSGTAGVCGDVIFLSHKCLELKDRSLKQLPGTVTGKDGLKRLEDHSSGCSAVLHEAQLKEKSKL